MWHIIWSCSTFLQSIIKIQRIFDLQSGHKINGLSLSNITKGDNSKNKKGRVVILVRDTSSYCLLHFYQVPSKYSKGYWSYRVDTKSFSNKKKRVITPRVRKPELSILYVTHHLILIYSSTTIKIFKSIFKLQSGKEGLCQCWHQRDPSQKQYVPPTHFGRGDIINMSLVTWQI